MGHERIALELPENVAAELRRMAQTRGITVADMAAVAIQEWLLLHPGESADEAGVEKYFVNQALDELIEKKSGG